MIEDEINNKIYTDGSLLETYPIKYVDNSGADLVIIVGFDQEVVNFEKPNCTNLIYFYSHNKLEQFLVLII